MFVLLSTSILEAIGRRDENLSSVGDLGMQPRPCSLPRGLEQPQCVNVLAKLLVRGGLPEHVRSDNSLNFARGMLGQWAWLVDLEVGFHWPCKPDDPQQQDQLGRCSTIGMSERITSRAGVSGPRSSRTLIIRRA